MSKKNVLLQWLQLCGIEKNVESFQAGTVLDHSWDQIILLITGVLHLENSNNKKRIITYLNGEYLLNPVRILQKDTQKYQMISDTNIEVIQITQAEFKKLVKEKPSIMEWLINDTVLITGKIITEFSKSKGVSLSKMQYSISILNEEGLLKPSETYKGWYELPLFITKEDFMSYSQISKRTFQDKLKELEANHLFHIEKRKIFVNGCFFDLE